MQEICKNFRVTEEEYATLNTQFGRLVKDIGWKLLRKNHRNNHTDEVEDIFQDIEIAMLRAASYHKRQVYIESCLKLCKEHIKDKFLKYVVEELEDLWVNKTRHGASRQRFGPHQERLLYKLIKRIVPASERPSKNSPLKIDNEFKTYCKSIMWNEQKAKGKKITREKPLRSGQVSLQEFSYLDGEI